ncbi:hypothetical protein MHC_02460 [Mycoplasma haemocanis str. Illinois]|uniref:Uncharacterized protein n=1 Tax=Mycoplasma haemocanis (strain Illinois) TaxID=1111676 RepID=H6N6T4_MYCHN|nr:hypothetical protein [Mycoplasma haemocanis]AEW45356.1 hypothetical protein MHC_02460 [Mycoplasma haemocanis str. Illinois]
MFAAGLSKGILGISVAVGTGVGLGSAALMSTGSNPFSGREFKPPVGCKLYKIESSSSGKVTRVTKEAIERELGENGKQYYPEIKNVCSNASGGNVFLSKKDRQYWRYYSEDQNHQKVKEYLQQNPDSEPSS